MLLPLVLVGAAALSSFPSVRIVDFHDGDTFRVYLTDVPDVFGKKVSVRIRGIDAPEIKDERECVRKDAELSKKKLENYLNERPVDLVRCQRDKYFRIVCDVKIAGARKEDDAAAHMLAAGLAKPYDGRAKTPWTCKKR